MAQSRAFGRPKTITGKAGSFESTLVPMHLLNHLRSHPIPITVSGSNLVTFTVNAGVTNPVPIWNGRDFMYQKETLTHTMGNSATNTIIATTGALASSQTPGSTGVKYYYMGLDSDGAVSLHPSTVAPSYVEGPFSSGILSHPGTARDRHWNYVGFSYMSATTPAFSYFNKQKYDYNFSNHAYAGASTQNAFVTVAVGPAHGVKVAGFVTGTATGSIVILGGATHGVTTNSVVGGWQALPAGVSAAALGDGGRVNFEGITLDSSGNILTNLDTSFASVNININRITDIV